MKKGNMIQHMKQHTRDLNKKQKKKGSRGSSSHVGKKENPQSMARGRNSGGWQASNSPHFGQGWGAADTAGAGDGADGMTTAAVGRKIDTSGRWSDSS